ncbi:MAG: glycine C-acetyltransferase [Sphaerochaetaceae bacterium]
MLSMKLKQELEAFVQEQAKAGTLKNERIIESPQSASISVAGKPVLNFCANNYLGLSDDKKVIQAAKDAMDIWGYGLSSVRFICGTQVIHKQLEEAISAFFHTEDTILFSSCFDANGALFEPLVGEGDVIISDELNHASIIDGVRLSKAQRLRYRHSNMEELEHCLIEAQGARRRIICTDGVFSMDGDIACLDRICSLAEKYDSLVMVDDSHASGYIGKTGRGTGEYWGVQERIDLMTTTFGKALGGASGGCITGRKSLIDLYRQRARPYLFSNTVAPAICGGTLQVLKMLSSSNPYAKKTMENALHFRSSMEQAGFDLVKGDTAIVPVMIYDETKAVAMADALLKEGVYVIGFTYPVVPKGKARIRVQLSAAHTASQIDDAVHAFIKIGRMMNIIK